MKSNNILILYASIDGQTFKISDFLKQQLESNGCKVSLFEICTFTDQLEDFDKIVIGCSIRYGVHHKSIIDFIAQHQEILEKHKTVFFSVNLVARKPEKNRAETNPYVIKFFKSITWKPTLVEVFAGKLDYKKYPIFDRIMIQFIMWITKGPTDTNTKIEYTDWDRVTSLSEKIVAL